MPWDYDDNQFHQQAKADPVWYLERLIQYGDGTIKLNRELLLKHFHELNIPEDRRAFLELLLWNKPF